MPRDAEAVLPLNTRVFCVLLVLAEEPRHGYAIAKAVQSITDGRVRLTPGTLYPLVRQLLVDGWILELPEDEHDPRRRRYRLSAVGRRVAQAEAGRLEGLLHAARTLHLLPRSSNA
jgi:DNA-binding PadR family transcriptional regulator